MWIAFCLNERRKAKSDLTTAIVPAGTSYPGIDRELVYSLCYPFNCLFG